MVIGSNLSFLHTKSFCSQMEVTNFTLAYGQQHFKTFILINNVSNNNSNSKEKTRIY